MKDLSRRFCLVAALAFAILGGNPLAGRAFADDIKLKANDRIIFLGDSITQAGAGPGGYVTLVKEALAKNYADLKIDVIGAGISGNKVLDLINRLDRDVLSKKPTIVVIYIGINDVWHWTNGKGTKKEDFDSGLRGIIKNITTAGAKVILCTPTVIGEKTDGTNPQDKMLDEYSDVSRAIAKETESEMLDLRKLFLDYLKQHNKANADKGILTSDTVHLNPAGNHFLANRMLEKLGAAPFASNADKKLRHFVLFKFKDDAKADQVAAVVKAFGALPSKIDTIIDFEMGTDVSVEMKAAGFTHGFMVTFANEKGRETYLPHPAHQEFVKLVGPVIDKVLVFDYWAK
ncbi:MAG: Stress responsive alpha-beta barrel domain protein [Planctomycetaceae bacterium]|nr:Stress responsive alpha-beta barrel domain protein [Planctomycetaceae bacterium]